MVDVIVMALMVACFLAVCVLPLAVLEIIRLGRRNRELAERNASQAAALWVASRAPAREEVRTGEPEKWMDIG